MSVVDVFRKNKDFSIESIVLDVLISESHDRSANVTENPVEDGTVFNDHIANNPVTLSIEGFITNTSISLFRNLNNLIAPDSRVNSVFDSLLFLFEEKLLVQVVTNLKVYENMAIENLSIPKDADSGDAFNFTMDLKQIIKVSKVTTQIPKSKVGGSAATKAQAQGKINGGKKTPGAATGAPKTKATSILKGIFG
jgi:hypothetical protein